MMQKVKIIITDDHKIVRDGIKAMLLGNRHFEIINEASTGNQLLSILTGHSPDIIVLDIGLPDIWGIELIPKIIMLQPKNKILILSANCDEATITACIKSGAHGFLHKDSSKEEFLSALKAIYEDEGYFSENLSKLIFKSYVRKLKEQSHDNQSVSKTLSEREIEIIRLFSDGMSFKEIADKLSISPRTVESHKNNILEKLELRNTIELVKYAFKTGIINI